MQGGFSDALIERARRYFSAKYGEDVSAERTVEYLHALADLYERFEVMAGAGTAAGALAPRLPAPDLISPHSC